MIPISSARIPQVALLDRYRQEGAYTDCYASDIALAVSQADYVEAFYTTWLFKLERWILSWLALRPSTDAEAYELALGLRDRFAAWNVEARTDDQLLLCDLLGNTRSWLMSVPVHDGMATRLYFGSAIVPEADPHTGARRLGLRFRLLLGFHRRYSRALLRAAVRRLVSAAVAPRSG